MSFPVLLFLLNWVHEKKETGPNSEWMKERLSQISKNMFTWILTMIGKYRGFSLLYFIVTLKLGVWKSETEHNSEWMQERQSQKIKNIFTWVVVMIRKSLGFNLPCFIIPFKLGVWKRDNNEVGVTKKKKTTEKEILLIAFQPY